MHQQNAKTCKGRGVGRRLANLCVAARAEELEIGRGVVIRGRHDVINVKSKAKQVAPVALATEVHLRPKSKGLLPAGN